MISILERIASEMAFRTDESIWCSPQEKAVDNQPDPDFFWYGWTDVVSAGALIFAVTAMPDGQLPPGSRKQLRQLGNGQTPKR